MPKKTSPEREQEWLTTQCPILEGLAEKITKYEKLTGWQVEAHYHCLKFKGNNPSANFSLWMQLGTLGKDKISSKDKGSVVVSIYSRRNPDRNSIIGPWIQDLFNSKKIPCTFFSPRAKDPEANKNEEGKVVYFSFGGLSNLADNDLEWNNIRQRWTEICNVFTDAQNAVSNKSEPQPATFNEKNKTTVEDYLAQLLGQQGGGAGVVDEVEDRREKPKEVETEKLSPLEKNVYNLLKSNHQVILTGAPGTGKTFMAKKVAMALSGDEWLEKEGKWKFGRIASVQFHPGYDYSDFVIGMKPVLLSKGGKELEMKNGKYVLAGTDTVIPDKDIGEAKVSFRWKDGIFKEFADKARRNFDVEIILPEFFSDAIDKKTEFKTEGRKSRFTISEVNDGRIKIEIPDNEKVNNVDLEIEIIRKLLFANRDFKKAMDVSRYLGRPSLTTGKVNTRQEDSYYFALWQAIRLRMEEMKFSTQDKTESGPEAGMKYVFLVDEINRADLSRVFGELFSLLEEEYRYPNGKGTDSILLPNGERFSIPKNLFIIGTMNDIDRSVESMDFALRRRFAWKEVKASDTAEDILVKAKNEDGSPRIEKTIAQKLMDAMSKLNDRISGKRDLEYPKESSRQPNPEIDPNQGGAETKTEDKTEKRKINLGSILGTAYELGAAYFAKFEKCRKQTEDDTKAAGMLWDNHIKVILVEYLRGRKDRDALLIGLRNVFDKAVK